MPTLADLVKDADTLATNLRALLDRPSSPPPPGPVDGDALAVARYLADKKLTEPVNDKGLLSGRAREILPPNLVGYSSPYFSVKGRVITFNCPPKGATTATAKYPRVELKYLKEFSVGEPWNDTITLAVDTLAEGQKVVIHQIHDKDEPWVKIVADARGGSIRIRALAKQTDGAADTELLLSAGVHKLGAPFASTLDWDPKKKLLTCGIDGQTRSTPLSRKGKGGKAYGKAGDYVQGGPASVSLRHFVP